MKKRFKRGAALLLTLAMLLGLNCVPASAAVTTDGYGNIKQNATFEDGSLSGFQRAYADKQQVYNLEVEDAPVDRDTHGKAVYMRGGKNANATGTTKSYNQFIMNQYTLFVSDSGTKLDETSMAALQKIKYSVDVLLVDSNTTGTLSAVVWSDSETRPVRRFVQFRDGKYFFEGHENNKYDYVTNKWYTFTFYIDWTAQKWTGYVDDQCVVKNANWPWKNTKEDKYLMAGRAELANQETNGSMWVDNIQLALPSDPTFESVTPANNTTGFPLTGGEVSFLFSNPLDTTQTIAATVTGGERLFTATAKVDGGNVIVKANEALAADTDYTFTVPVGVKDCNGRVTAAAQSVTVHTAKATAYSEPVAVSGDASSITAETTVTNNGKKAMVAAIVIAAYDEDGNLIGKTVIKKDVAKDATETFNATLNEEMAEDLADAAKIYAYAVDGETLTNPLTPYAYEITADKTTKMTNDCTPTTVTLNEFNVSSDTGKITVKGSVEPKKETLVYINVEGPKTSGVAASDIATIAEEGGVATLANETTATTEPYVLRPVKTDANGEFTFEYEQEDFVSGTYAVSVGGWQSPTASQSAYVLDKQVSDEIIAAVNGATDAAAVKAALEPHKAELNADAALFCDNAYQTVYEQKGYGSVEAIIAMMKKAEDLRATVNKTNWSDLPGVLTNADNKSILFKDNMAIVNTLEASAEEVQKEICSYMTADYQFATFVALRTSLTNAIAKYEENQNNPSTGITPTPTPSIVSGGGTRPSTSNSNKGGGSGMLYVGGAAATPTPSATPTPTPSTTVETPFADMKDAAWASEHVASLAEKGIISGDANGNFRPNDAVTREEFVKLLVGALGIEVGETAESFTDADINAWYAKYLAAAKAAGIITGNEDGTFGVGAEITRQDMAVMAVRAVNAIGKTLPSGGATFTDSDSISSYAAQAVGQMQEAGILNGIGNGTFAPMDSTSRAAAAKVIDSLMNLVIGK